MQKLTIGQIAENRLSRYKPDIIPISKAKEPSVRRGQKLGRKGQKTLKRQIMEDQRQHCLLGLRHHLLAAVGACLRTTQGQASHHSSVNRRQFTNLHLAEKLWVLIASSRGRVSFLSSGKLTAF